MNEHITSEITSFCITNSGHNMLLSGYMLARGVNREVKVLRAIRRSGYGIFIQN